MRDLTSEAKGYDINFSYKGKMFHINSSRLDKTGEKLKQFDIEIYQKGETNCIYLSDERKAIGEIKVLPTDLRLKLKQVEDCTNFGFVFIEAPSEFLDLKDWNTSRGKNFSGMFYRCMNLNTLDLSNWDTSQGEDFSFMFYNCFFLEFLNLSGWDLSNGRSFSYMFEYCEKLAVVKAKGCNDFTIKRLRELVPEECEVVY